jgi:hypothetical protein
MYYTYRATSPTPTISTRSLQPRQEKTGEDRRQEETTTISYFLKGVVGETH